ncbi:hypothetical protein CF70_002750 [Cupriavidus sp. SK-3]|nr:hypothetical protein CF70_002750 [Cupriavidus sp. SK-3]
MAAATVGAAITARGLVGIKAQLVHMEREVLGIMGWAKDGITAIGIWRPIGIPTRYSFHTSSWRKLSSSSWRR